MASSSQKDYITIVNGAKVHINDHVYVSPPWELRDGIPYSIARIMEFLPPENLDGDSMKTTSNGTTNGRSEKEPQTITRVRLAWYYRPSDLSDRQVADSRLLLAAIFSEVQPVSFLRAKCHVKHKDKIQDLNSWRKLPDRFYFSKLFDPYIKKEYEVIKSTDVHNLPANIKSVLQSRYEFVITEKEVVSDLTDEIRECESCSEWCPAPESVQCDNCKLFFHMLCVQPPLAAKPAKGYGWTCAPCTLHHEERLDRKLLGKDDSPVKIKQQQANGGRRGGKDRAAEPPRSRMLTEDKYFHMWPYRYFGLHTFAEDTLDPDDMIFPRAATRIGQRFQCVIPQDHAPLSGAEDQLPVRGGDETVEVLGTVVHMKESNKDKVEKLLHKMYTWAESDSPYQIDYVEEVVRRICELKPEEDIESVRIRSPVRPRKWHRGQYRIIDKDWTPEEVRAFEKGLENYNAELFSVAGDIPGRSTAEVVRFYGHWKNRQLGKENKKFSLSTGQVAPTAPTKFRRTVSVRSSTDPDDEGSVVNGQNESDSSNKPATSCGSCKTRVSTVWWKGPKGLPSPVMCETCGIAWRKYGDIKGTPKLDEPPTKAIKAPTNGVEKRSGTPLPPQPSKRPKVGSSELKTLNPVSTRPPVRGQPMPPPNKHGACACCRKVGLAGTVVKCRNCNLVVHTSAYGVTKSDVGNEDWLCEVCANEKHQEFALKADCLLCPRPPHAPAAPTGKGSSGEFLRAWKPTEGRGWVHAICSIFIPEIQYTDATGLRFVEGMSSLPSWRWKESCTFCKQTGGGAVVKCPDCPMKFHLSCAWKNQLRFGFELTPKQTQQPDDPPLVTFRGVSGILEPFVWCNAHVLEQNRIVWGPCDASEGETALQMYCRNYKQVPLKHSYGLLRRAYRLDQALAAPAIVPAKPTIESDKSCFKCATKLSPYFFPMKGRDHMSDGGKLVQCHACYFKERNSSDQIVVDGSSEDERGRLAQLNLVAQMARSAYNKYRYPNVRTASSASASIDSID